MLSRRFFVLGCAGAAASGALLTMSLPAAAGHGDGRPGLLPLRQPMFEVLERGQVVARLELDAFHTPSCQDRRVYQCTLGFRASNPVHLPEGTYRLSHPELGEFDVFLQPAGTLDRDHHDGYGYRCCLSVLRDQAGPMARLSAS